MTNELTDRLSVKIEYISDNKKSDGDNNHFESKDNQNNSEDGKEELELSEMIVCDEVAGDSDEVFEFLYLCYFIFMLFIVYMHF